MKWSKFEKFFFNFGPIDKYLFKTEKQNLKRFLFLNLSISILDLFALATVSIASLSLIPIVQSNEENIPKLVTTIYAYFSAQIELSEFVYILLILSVSVLLFRNLIGYLIYKKNQRYLGILASNFTNRILEKFLSIPINIRKNNGDSFKLRTFTESSESAVIYSIGGRQLLLTEISTVIITLAGVVFLVPLFFLPIILTLLIIGYLNFNVIKYQTIETTKILKNQIDLLNESMLNLFNSESELKVFNTLSKYLKKQGKIRRDYFLAKSRRIVVQSKSKYFLELFIFSSLIIILIFLWLFFDATKAISFIGVIFMASLRIIPSISRIVSYRSMIVQHDILAFEISEICKLTDDLFFNFRYENTKSEFQNLEINASHIRVFQSNDKIVLNDLSFDFIGPGIFVISGSNGSGKTTLVNAILGLYAIDSGELSLTVDKKYNNPISFMPQKPGFIPGSLKDNIIFLREDIQINNQEIINLLEIFDLHFSDLEEPLNNRSGGEMQKIGLVRNLLSESPILILDEPSNNLDANSLKILKGKILELSKSKMIILISHDSNFINGLRSRITSEFSIPKP